MQFLQSQLVASVTGLLRDFLEVTASPDAYSFDKMRFEDISTFELRDVAFSPEKLSEFFEGYPLLVESCKVGLFKLQLADERIQVLIDGLKLVLTVHEKEPLAKPAKPKTTTDWTDRSLASSQDFVGLRGFTNNLGGSLRKDYLSDLKLDLHSFSIELNIPFHKRIIRIYFASLELDIKDSLHVLKIIEWHLIDETTVKPDTRERDGAPLEPKRDDEATMMKPSVVFAQQLDIRARIRDGRVTECYSSLQRLELDITLLDLKRYFALLNRFQAYQRKAEYLNQSFISQFLPSNTTSVYMTPESSQEDSEEESPGYVLRNRPQSAADRAHPTPPHVTATEFTQQQQQQQSPSSSNIGQEFEFVPGKDLQPIRLVLESITTEYQSMGTNWATRVGKCTGSIGSHSIEIGRSEHQSSDSDSAISIEFSEVAGYVVKLASCRVNTNLSDDLILYCILLVSSFQLQSGASAAEWKSASVKYSPHVVFILGSLEISSPTLIQHELHSKANLIALTSLRLDSRSPSEASVGESLSPFTSQPHEEPAVLSGPQRHDYLNSLMKRQLWSGKCDRLELNIDKSTLTALLVLAKQLETQQRFTDSNNAIIPSTVTPHFIPTAACIELGQIHVNLFLPNDAITAIAISLEDSVCYLDTPGSSALRYAILTAQTLDVSLVRGSHKENVVRTLDRENVGGFVLDASFDLQGQAYIALRQLLVRYAKGDDWALKLLTLIPENMNEDNAITELQRNQLVVPTPEIIVEKKMNSFVEHRSPQPSPSASVFGFGSDSALLQSFLFQSSPTSTTPPSTSQASSTAGGTFLLTTNTLSPSPQASTTANSKLSPTIPNSPLIPSSPLNFPSTPIQQSPVLNPIEAKSLPTVVKKRSLFALAAVTDCLVLYTPSRKLPLARMLLDISSGKLRLDSLGPVIVNGQEAVLSLRLIDEKKNLREGLHEESREELKLNLDSKAWIPTAHFDSIQFTISIPGLGSALVSDPLTVEITNQLMAVTAAPDSGSLLIGVAMDWLRDDSIEPELLAFPCNDPGTYPHSLPAEIVPFKSKTAVQLFYKNQKLPGRYSRPSTLFGLSPPNWPKCTFEFVLSKFSLKWDCLPGKDLILIDDAVPKKKSRHERGAGFLSILLKHMDYQFRTFDTRAHVFTSVDPVSSSMLFRVSDLSVAGTDGSGSLHYDRTCKKYSNQGVCTAQWIVRSHADSPGGHASLAFSLLPLVLEIHQGLVESLASYGAAFVIHPVTAIKPDPLISMVRLRAMKISLRVIPYPLHRILEWDQQYPLLFLFNFLTNEQIPLRFQKIQIEGPLTLETISKALSHMYSRELLLQLPETLSQSFAKHFARTAWDLLEEWRLASEGYLGLK